MTMLQAQQLLLIVVNNVGIGTASPSEILHIEGNSPYLVISNTGENVGGIKMYDSADSGGQYFHLTYDSASSNEVSFDTGASGEYTFNVNTAEKMRINSSGNLGIGTSSPTFLNTTGSASSKTIGLYNSGTATSQRAELQLGSAATASGNLTSEFCLVVVLLTQQKIRWVQFLELLMQHQQQLLQVL
jgi:hypothetical protein